MQNAPQRMKAMAVDEFGGSNKLTLHTLPVPTVDADEVLIRVEIAGVGIWDAMAEREGDLVYNEVQFPRVLGGECAGTIVAIGDSVERLAVGDQVYAQSFMSDKDGSCAEYVVISEKTVAPMPDGLDMLVTGGLPIAGATALSNLNALAIGNETTLMLWGANGGVGHVALQLAKRMGARVFASTCPCSGAIASGADGVALAHQLGADEAVDGHSNDIAGHARAFAPDGFDAALVLVGGNDVESALSLVRPGGIISFPNGVMPEPKAPDSVELKKTNADPMVFNQLNRLIDMGEFQVHIAQTFPLEEAAQAQDAMKQHYLGKIVLSVSGE